MSKEVERLERQLDELALRVAHATAPDELVALLLAEIEATKEKLRRTQDPRREHERPA